MRRGKHVRESILKQLTYQKINYHNNLPHQVQPKKPPAHGLRLFLLRISRLSLLVTPLLGDFVETENDQVTKRIIKARKSLELNKKILF